MNHEFAEFVRELIEASRRGWEEFFSDRRGEAEIVLDFLRGALTQTAPQSDPDEPVDTWLEEVKTTLDALYRHSTLESFPERVLACVERNFWPSIFTFASERENRGLDLPPASLVAGDLFLACLNRCV